MLYEVNGKSPQIHPESFVHEAAILLGDVKIGEESSIWPGAVIRADAGKIAIGNNTCIQDNSVLHGDADVEIGNNVVIGHKVLCHAAKIGNRVLLGNGSTVNDGVIIGSDSLIASGTVLPDKQSIPAKSIVMGVPGKIRSEINQKFIDLIKNTSEAYAKRAIKYKKEGNLES